jgi:hypothetical protein
MAGADESVLVSLAGNSKDGTDASAKRQRVEDDKREMQTLVMSMMSAQQEQFAKILADQQKMMFEFMSKDQRPVLPTVDQVETVATPQPSTAANPSASMEKLEKDMEEILMKEKVKFTKKVKTFLRSKDTLSKRSKEFKLMMDDTSCSRLPEPMKAYKPPPTEGELDEAWSLSKEADYKMTLDFPKGTSMRRALELAYWYAVKTQKQIYAESAKAKVDTMQTASRKEAFVETCKLSCEKAQSSEDATALGLDATEFRTIDESFFKGKVEKLYAEVLKLAVKSKKDDDTKANGTEEEKESVNNELEALRPLEVMSEFLEGNDMDDQETVPAADNLVSKFKTMVKDLNTNLLPLISKNGYGGSEAPPNQKPEKPELDCQKPKQWHWQNQKGKGKGDGKNGKGKGGKGAKGAPQKPQKPQQKGQKSQKGDAKGGWKDNKAGGKTGGAKGRNLQW